MKDFALYTALRLALFASTFLAVFGIWSLFTDTIPLIWVLLVAVVLSSVASVYFLKGPRDRLAARIEQRAGRASSRFEEMRSREDVD